MVERVPTSGLTCWTFPHACTRRDHESRPFLASNYILSKALHLIQIAEPGLGEGDASFIWWLSVSSIEGRLSEKSPKLGRLSDLKPLRFVAELCKFWLNPETNLWSVVHWLLSESTLWYRWMSESCLWYDGWVSQAFGMMAEWIVSLVWRLSESSLRYDGWVYQAIGMMGEWAKSLVW